MVSFRTAHHWGIYRRLQNRDTGATRYQRFCNVFCSGFSKTCNKSAVSETIKMHGEFRRALQGNAGNRSKGPNKRRSILGRSFHIDLIPRHF
jgi:hypothetical protein